MESWKALGTKESCGIDLKSGVGLLLRKCTEYLLEIYGSNLEWASEGPVGILGSLLQGLLAR